MPFEDRDKVSGSGVFLLPERFGTETGVLGAIIAWTIAATGIFAYAKAGFGDYIGSTRQSDTGRRRRVQATPPIGWSSPRR